jgi:hypothetical protein
MVTVVFLFFSFSKRMTWGHLTKRNQQALFVTVFRDLGISETQCSVIVQIFLQKEITIEKFAVRANGVKVAMTRKRKAAKRAVTLPPRLARLKNVDSAKAVVHAYVHTALSIILKVLTTTVPHKQLFCVFELGAYASAYATLETRMGIRRSTKLPKMGMRLSQNSSLLLVVTSIFRRRMGYVAALCGQ